MGLLLLCETSDGDEIPKTTCILNNLFFICNSLIMLLICYQIFLRLFFFKIPFKKETIIFYIVFFQSVVYELYNGFETFISAYLIEIYLRHICFIYTMWFYSLKAWKFDENQRKKKVISLVAFIFGLYFTAVLISSLFRTERMVVCKDSFWLYLSISGIFLSLGFAGVALKLSRKVSKKIKHFGIYENLNQTSVAEDIKNKNTVVKKKVEMKMENVWKIVLFMSLSHFLSFCIYLFYILNDTHAEDCPLIILDKEFQKDQDKTIVVYMLVMIIVKIICYFLPITVIVLTFWKKKEGEFDSSDLDEEDIQAYFKNLDFNAPGSKKRGEQPISISSSSEAPEILHPPIGT